MTDWEKRELGEILVLNYGWSLPEKRRVAGDYPVYGSNGIVGWHNVPLVETQGLIIGRKGSAGNVHYSRKPFCPIDTTFFITPNDTSLEIEFLYYLLLHIDLKRVLGDVGVPGLNREVAYKEKTCFPPDKSEQRRIAHILSTVQTAIAQQERLLALTGELKATLLRKLFTEGLRGEPQKMTEIGLVPESWEIKRFDEFVALQRGQDLPRYSFKEGSIPVIGATSIIGFHDKANVKGPGVTVVRSGSSAGKPLFITEDFWAHNVVLYVKDFHGNDVKFVYYKILELDLTRYKAGVAVPTLNRNTFKGIEIAVPTKNEQEDIAKTLDAVERKIEVGQKKKIILQELFRTLLHQLMTAQIRV